MSRNRCDTVCACGLTLSYWPKVGRRLHAELFDGAEYLKQIGWEDCPYSVNGWPNKKATLFSKVICPLCRLEFLGWYEPPSLPKYDGLEWELYDTSYWSTYNDEPGEADRKNWRDPIEVLHE